MDEKTFADFNRRHELDPDPASLAMRVLTDGIRCPGFHDYHRHGNVTADQASVNQGASNIVGARLY
jgi:hypothetical protein